MNVSPPPSSLEKWVRRQLGDITEDGVIDRFELFHAIDGEGGEKLQTFRAPEDDGFDFDTIVQDLWDVAFEDASTREAQMSQRYAVQAWRGEAREPEATHSFRIQGMATVDYLGAQNSEMPNAKGRMSQEMRHSENLHRMLLSMNEMTVGRLGRDLEAERARRVHAEEQLFKNFELQQQLLDRSHERALETAREDQKAQRHEQMMGVFMAMLPLVASKFLGGKAAIGENMPASSARDHAVGKLLGSLSEAEAVKVFSSLQPHNQMVLMELYQSYKKDHDQEENNKPEILRHGSSKEVPQEN